MPLSLLLTVYYARITIELNSICKQFITRLCNKRTLCGRDDFSIGASIVEMH